MTRMQDGLTHVLTAGHRQVFEAAMDAYHAETSRSPRCCGSRSGPSGREPGRRWPAAPGCRGCWPFSRSPTGRAGRCVGQVSRFPPPAHVHRHVDEGQQQEAELPRPRVVPGPWDLRGEGDEPPGTAAFGDERGAGDVEQREQHAAECEGHRSLLDPAWLLPEYQIT